MGAKISSEPVLQVAVAAPVFGLFDYLPKPGTQTNDYRIGQRVAVPFGNRQLVGIILSIATPENSQLQLKPLQAVFGDEALLDAQMLEWLRWAARYYCHPLGDTVSHALPSLMRKPKAFEPKQVSLWRRSKQPAELAPNARRQQELITLLEQHAEGLWHETLTSMGYNRQQLKSLQNKGLIEEERIDSITAAPARVSSPSPLTLNEEQKQTLAAIHQDLLRFQVFLLQGVTGSGKTEIYIESVKKVMAQGRQALILVPEINLTPQTLKRFQQRFDEAIGSFHSGMSEKEKASVWDLARRGIARIIIGTRSAAFLPFQQLGIVVIDEEHDSSFKQQDGFKYSARDLCIKRAQMLDIPILLGSATPSLESLANAHAGRFRLLQLAQRAGGARLPQVQVIDVRNQPLQDGLSSTLLTGMRETLASNKQVILFQNRRGYSPTLMCQDCGWIAGCVQCDVRLTVHRHPAHLHCHHCNYQCGYPTQCPGCKGIQLAPVGTGTERLEYALKRHFKDTPVYRMDRDSIDNQTKLHSLLDAINQAEPCIVVGTQMIAKGHDFQHVALVGIVDADGLFFSADFRAIERGAQLLIQVAGRAGRGSTQGKVLIQTRQPEHELFGHIAKGQYSRIARQELELRETCELPPFSRMISIRADAKQADKAQQQLTELVSQLETSAKGELGYCAAGPFEAIIARRLNLFRFYLHLYFNDAADRQRVSDWLATIIARGQTRGVRLSIDIDPAEYL